MSCKKGMTVYDTPGRILMEAGVTFVGMICRYGFIAVKTAISRSVGGVAKIGCNVAYKVTTAQENCKWSSQQKSLIAPRLLSSLVLRPLSGIAQTSLMQQSARARFTSLLNALQFTASPKPKAARYL